MRHRLMPGLGLEPAQLSASTRGFTDLLDLARAA